jgi:hypothetical protein
MDLRSIVTYLSMKDMNTDMNNTLGADCIGYSSVTKYLREKSFLKSMVEADFAPKNEEENFIVEALLAALEEFHFSSLCQIAKRRIIPMITVRIFEVSNQEQSMGSPPALIEPKSITC